ncbi:Pectinesterase [Mycena venus]|uniref:pectinesterase n=1 Tax=Mycena venus TaxID=2733690 RepID=A0A8H6YJB5_9AGAR|nr:Pectinesterase [Mycena venus]
MVKFSVVFLSLCLVQYALAASRTTPPSGAIVVRQGTTTSGEFATLTAALNSLPNDSSSRSIFIFPGTYAEQIDITRTGPLTIYGYTTDTTTYTGNQVIITAGVPASTAGSDDASGTLRIHKNDFKGAVDFIFGREGLAYFGGNTIAVNGPGCITASGRESADSGSYVFNENTIILATDAASGTSGNIFLGRPWGDFAKVIFKKYCDLGDNEQGTMVYLEYGRSPPSFATVLSASQAAAYNISSAVGSDFASWVDAAYIV